MRKNGKITKWSVGLNILLAAALIYAIIQYNAFSGVTQLLTKEPDTSGSPYYDARNGVFQTTTGPKGGTIFLGDSLTDMNEWSEAFPEKNIKNRGIFGDTTQTILKRLDVIIEQEPDQLFIMAGINDLAEKQDLKEIVKGYESIVEEASSRLPETEIYIQSVLPNHEQINTKANIKNEEIKELNKELEALASSRNLHFIDLYSEFTDSKGQLKKSYTVDGVHLNGKGYKVWEQSLIPYLIS